METLVQLTWNNSYFQPHAYPPPHLMDTYCPIVVQLIKLLVK